MSRAYNSMAGLVIHSWRIGSVNVRLVISIAGLLGLAGLFIAALGDTGHIDKTISKPITFISFVLSGILLIALKAYQKVLLEEDRERRIAVVEKNVLDHPERPQYAWDLARTKLESYLDRNLGQLRSIYWLTLLVMLGGFALVVFGLYRAFEAPDKLPIAIVSSASGVLISFIGGSFLLIYRSVLSQSKEYVTVLERINAVGMAVQVISSIPDDQSELRGKTTAELAGLLLSLYSSKQASLRKAVAQKK